MTCLPSILSTATFTNELGDLVLQKIQEALSDGGASRDRALHMCLLWGLGKPAPQQTDGGHHTLQVVLKQPLGTDPVALRIEREAEADRRDAGGARPAGAAGDRPQADDAAPEGGQHPAADGEGPRKPSR